ncbi:acyltransferase family protein [Actinophytocola sediminis]
MSEQLAARPADPATVPNLPAVDPAARAKPPAPEPTTRRGRLNGLDLLRALASCLVFYTHIATWYRFKQDPMPVSGVIDEYVIAPLHLNKELGFIGVALFFVISGFVMAHVATKERAGEFAVKRLMRILPSLIVGVLLAWVLVNVGVYSIPGGATSVGADDLLANMFLLNFFIDGYSPLVGVAWTLVTQLSVYLMIGALLWAFRRMPWLAIALQITVCSVILSILPNFRGLTASSIANIGAFGTAIVLGQVIWLVWTKNAPVWTGALLGLACWLVFTWGDSLGYGRYDDGYTITLTFVALLVILAVVASHRVPRFRLVTYLSSRSYVVYLVHQTIAFTVLAQLWPDVPSSLAVAASIVATLVVAELVHRAVEKPFSKLATTLTRRVSR